MKIVIDTNILCQDYFLEKPHFRVLLEGCSVIPATIHIPEVVIDEVVNRYKEDLEEAIFKFKNASKTIYILTKEEIKSKIDINTQVNKYKALLLSKLNDRKIDIISYPIFRIRKLLSVT